MRDEYDFSNSERSEFYNPNATISLPVYLEAEVLDYFAAKSQGQGRETQQNGQ